MNKFKQAVKSWFIPGTENDHKPHILRNKSILVFAIFVLCIKLMLLGLFSFFPNTAYFSVITADKLVQLTNQTRQANGLQPLEINDELNQAAYLKAQDMLSNNYFSHTSPQGISPWYWFKQAGYNYNLAGENLAADFTKAENLHNAWMNSSAHKANILNSKYEEIGIAIVTGEFQGKTTTIAVQHFGVTFDTSSIVEAIPQLKPRPDFAELEKENLASNRSTEKEPILTPQEEKIESQLPSIAKEKIKELKKLAIEIQTKKAPKILGTLIEKSDKIAKQIYVYAILFVVLALLLNIIIKFEVQHKGLIINALLIICLIILLIFIGNNNILDIGLNII